MKKKKKDCWEKYPGSFEISEGNITGRKKKQQQQQKQTNKQKKTPKTMFLTATTSREVSQMLVSASSEWELGRESWAVSLALRVRTWTECPEDNLREQM